MEITPEDINQLVAENPMAAQQLRAIIAERRLREATPEESAVEEPVEELEEV